MKTLQNNAKANVNQIKMKNVLKELIHDRWWNGVTYSSFIRTYEIMNLSRNFTLSELIKSDTAIRKGINNNPNAEQIEKLKDYVKIFFNPFVITMVELK